MPVRGLEYNGAEWEGTCVDLSTFDMKIRVPRSITPRHGRDEEHRPRFVDDDKREHDARGGNNERADAANEPDATVGVVGVPEGACEVADRAPAEHGGEDR